MLLFHAAPFLLLIRRPRRIPDDVPSMTIQVVGLIVLLILNIGAVAFTDATAGLVVLPAALAGWIWAAIVLMWRHEVSTN